MAFPAGSRGAGIRGLHTADYGVGTEFQGKTAGTGALPGVWEGTDEGVTGGATSNPERRGKRGVGVGGRREIRGQKFQDLQDGISREGSTKVLTSQRV